MVRPIPMRRDPGKSGFKGTFLLGKRACHRRAIKVKPISGIANWPTCNNGNFNNKSEIRLLDFERFSKTLLGIILRFALI